MNKLLGLVAGVCSVAALGLVGCSQELDMHGPTSGIASVPKYEGLPGEPCPESLSVPINEAMLGAVFPVWLPIHPLAPQESIVAACTDGVSVTFVFPDPRPSQAPLRPAGLVLWESPWEGGDPAEVWQAAIEAYPDDEGKKIYSVKGVPALGDAARDDETGQDAAYLSLVLEDVEIHLTGGESVEDLIAIAEALQRVQTP